MRTRFALMVFVLIASHALAQPAPSRRQTSQAPQPQPAPVQPAVPASSTPPPPPPPPPAPPGPPRREGQPINVKVELTITEEGGGAMSSKKAVSAVIGDGFNGYVRANGNNPDAAPSERFVPLNSDAYPVILSNGKIRLTSRSNTSRAPPNISLRLLLVSRLKNSGHGPTSRRTSC